MTPCPPRRPCPASLQRFVALGFHPGLETPRPAVGALHEFTGLMLCAFSSQPLEAGMCPAAAKLVHRADR